MRWSARTKRWLGYIVIGVTAVFALGALVFGARAGDGNTVMFVAIVVPAFLVAATLAMRAQPSNGAVWALAGAGLFGAASSFGSHLSAARTGLGVAAIEGGTIPGSPADYDLLSALGMSISLWAWIPSVFLIATLFLILFPDGHTPSRRWRIAAWVAGGSIFILSLQGAVHLAPWEATSYDALLASNDGTTMAPPLGLLMLPLMAIALFAVGRLVLHYRRTTGEERLQYRWVTWAVVLYVVVGIVLFEAVQTLGDVGSVISAALLANIPVSIGVAITKHRLYDVDVVISRTLVFAGLAGFITLVFAAVVVGIGSLFEGANVWLNVAAIAVVAVVFEPVRNRLQRWVNRLVYGQRATPYEVLSDLTGRLAVAETGEGLLDRMSLRLAEGTGAERAIVWTADTDGYTPAACEPASQRPGDLVPTLDNLPGAVVPIARNGEALGALSVEKRRGDVLNLTETRLIEDLAGSAGLFLARRRLDAELEEKARQLADSRRRLVNAQDVERRRLEQQLNEGAQQQVLGLKLQLGLAAQLAAAEGSDSIATMVQQMATETQHAIDQIRALADGIYPPLLEAEGLNAAVAALVDLAPMEAHLATTVATRYPLPTEAAIYFAIAEALTNATKHATGPIHVRVTDNGDHLTFEVTDSGPGFDPAKVERGAGLTNMTDRLDALGGTLTLTTRSGHPTTVTGRLPIPAAVRV